MTRTIREHMLKYHNDEYITKCREEGFKTHDEHNFDRGVDIDASPPAFTREGLIERLVRWMAVDDQVCRF